MGAPGGGIHAAHGPPDAFRPPVRRRHSPSRHSLSLRKVRSESLNAAWPTASSEMRARFGCAPTLTRSHLRRRVAAPPGLGDSGWARETVRGRTPRPQPHGWVQRRFREPSRNPENPSEDSKSHRRIRSATSEVALLEIARALKATRARGTTTDDQTYTAQDIEVLSGLEPVRRRPGMYTDTSRPNHLAHEVVDNSVDEALAGHCSRIAVTVYKDGSIEVIDDGRGMPVDIHPKEKVSGVELILTRLHAGGKVRRTRLTSSPAACTA